MGTLLRFVPNLLPGLQALANPWVLVLAGGIFLAGFTAGWKIESWRWDAANADALRMNFDAIKRFWEGQRRNNAAIAGQMNADKAKLETDRAAYEREKLYAKRKGLVEVSCQGVEPAGRAETAAAREAQPRAGEARSSARLSADACRLWNRGIAAGLPEAYGGWLADALSGCPGPAEIEDAIDNAEQNAAHANAFRSELIAWQTKACLEGWWPRASPECARLLKGPG